MSIEDADVPATVSTKPETGASKDAAPGNVEGRYQAFVEAALDEIFVFGRDRRIQYLNRAAATRLNRAATDVLGKRLDHVLPADRVSAALADIQRVLDTRTPIYTERPFTGLDGTVVWQSVWFVPLAQNHRDIDSILSIARDITARKRVEVELLESRERFKLIAETIDEVFWITDTERAKVFYVSPSYERIWGRTADSLYTDPTSLFDAIHPDDRARASAALRERQQAGHPFNEEYRIVHPDGSVKWIWDRGFPVPAGGGNEFRYVGIALDVTARKLAEERLQHDALFDTLTGLPNRALLLDRLQHAATRFRRNPNACFAVLFIDLDNFKAVNDRWGHDVGDQLLVAVANRLQLFLRPDDTLARLGGDEFVILTGDVKSPNDATHVADRILREVRQPFALAGHELSMSASIGIAPGSDNADSIGQLLHDADTAMYRAKRRGKGTYQTFGDEVPARRLRPTQLETDLRNALSQHQFTLLYQPIVKAQSGRIVRVEAFLRWQHPLHGQLEPAEFLSAAEGLGLMPAVGEWVRRTAFADASAWHAAGFPNPVAVNISPSEFSDPDFAGSVEAALKAMGLEPRAVELELSERVLFGSDASTVSGIRRLIDLGARLSIDDFQTSHVALRWLLTFPSATLKIDRSLIRDMLTDSTGARVIKALIALGHNLDLTVAAVGVETEEQKQFLAANNCDEMQGFHISALLTGAEVRALLASHE